MKKYFKEYFSLRNLIVLVVRISILGPFVIMMKLGEAAEKYGRKLSYKIPEIEKINR